MFLLTLAKSAIRTYRRRIAQSLRNKRCALGVHEPVIWTVDSHFDKQTRKFHIIRNYRICPNCKAEIVDGENSQA